MGIYAGSSNNTIGGSVAGSGDLISGNNSNGVYITDSGTTGNVVEGDLIGTNWTGSNRLPNAGSGVVIQNGAADNTIGGIASTSAGLLQGAGDVISGNDWEGVHIVASSGNVVEGDYIGLSVGGNEYVGNAESGVGIYSGASDNTIGGSVTGAGDVISGNNSNGVYITNAGTTGNVVEGDFVGTDWTGSMPMPNNGNGVVIQDAAAGNIIGGTASTIGGSLAGAGNVISGNSGDGVYISDSGTNDNVVQGDFIGTDLTGAYPVPNYDGVLIQDGAADNTIGAVSPGAPSDVISGNNWDGVHIVDGATANTVEGDYIGVNAWATWPCPTRRAAWRSTPAPPPTPSAGP